MIESVKQDNTKVVILHGFSHEEIRRVMRAVKQSIEQPELAAFAMTTEHSLQLKLGDVVEDVAAEHAYMRKHPPGGEPVS